MKTKRPNHTTAKKCKTEEPTNVNRKKPTSKKNKVELSKEVAKDIKEVVKLKVIRSSLKSVPYTLNISGVVKVID